MKLASGSLHRHGIVLLGPEVLEIARTKIESNVNKKYNRILGCMRKCFEREYKHSLIMSKVATLANVVINKLSIEEIKSIACYFSYENDRLIPPRKQDIACEAKEACH